MQGWSAEELEKTANSKTAPAGEVIAAGRVLAAMSQAISKSGVPIAGPEFDRVLDRTIGKPQQHVTVAHGETPEMMELKQMTLDELRRIADGMA